MSHNLHFTTEPDRELTRESQRNQDVSFAQGKTGPKTEAIPRQVGLGGIRKVAK